MIIVQTSIVDTLTSLVRYRYWTNEPSVAVQGITTRYYNVHYDNLCIMIPCTIWCLGHHKQKFHFLTICHQQKFILTANMNCFLHLECEKTSLLNRHSKCTANTSFNTCTTCNKVHRTPQTSWHHSALTRIHWTWLETNTIISVRYVRWEMSCCSSWSKVTVDNEYR